MNRDAATLLAAATAAAREAAAYLRTQEGRVAPAEWTRKSAADFVTGVDREAERMIAAALGAAVPGGRVVGEELTPALDLGGLTWIVDPLDGTTNFLHRFPMYAVSIAAAVDGVLEAACVLHVTPAICYTATRGGGARAGATPIRVSPIAEPTQALIGTGFPFKHAAAQLPRYLPMFSAVAARTAGMRRPGSAALDLCCVASGQFEGFFELELAPWDVAAGVLLVREAGGIVTTLEGEPSVLRHGSLLAGNPAMHRWLLELFREGR